VRFNFPSAARFRPISWEEWFANFDAYGLTFVYEEEVADRAYEFYQARGGEVWMDITLPLRYRVDFFCFGAVIDQDPMAQRGMGQGFDVFGRDIRSALQQGPHFPTEHQVLSGPQAGAPAYPFVDKVRALLLVRPGGSR
jgi:hypothetical protein